MAERKKLFSLELERFREASEPLSSRHPNCFRLQHEFKSKKVSLSQSLLIWRGESGNTWLLADFENQKTYDIELVEGTDEIRTVDVWELTSQTEQPVNLTDTESILSRLLSAQGTDQGFIDFLKRLNLDDLNLGSLKRSELSEAGFSFESVHQDLLIVHNMLQEILASPREWLLYLSREVVRNLNRHLPQFYANVRKIEDFEISGETPRDTHSGLLQEVSEFCDSAKEPLGRILAYLSSRKVGQLETNVKTTVAEAEDQLNNLMNRVNKIGKVAEANEATRQKKFEELEIAIQNQLAEKPISQYKSIFQEQAIEHHKNARFWLGMAGVATGAFVVAFVLLTIFVKFESTELAGTLQNLFTKGFLLSPIYVWLNRSIKNHTAQKHLEVINTHRQNALETFDTFVTAAGDNRETRDAVLLSATDAIFDANQTGYLSTKGSGSDNRSPIQQVIREIIPQKSSTKEG